MPEYSGDGVTILAGGESIPETSAVSSPSPPDPAVEDAFSRAQEIMQDRTSPYWNKNDPAHPRVLREVRAAFDAKYPAPPPEPEPSTPAPAPEPKTEPEPPKPPEAPKDPLDRVPAAPAGYQFRLSPPADDRVQWDPGQLDAFRTKAHALGVSHRQAQGLLDFVSGAVIPKMVEMGDAALDDSMAQKYAHQARLYGIPPATAQALAAWWLDVQPEIRPLPPRGKAPEILEAEELMADPASGYRDRNHPKHQSTNAKVKALFAKAQPRGDPGQGPGSVRR
jgi:hypothetical protein